MSTKLHVDNLSATTTHNELKDLFSAHGNVTEINLLMHGARGRPRGFGFVTMATVEGAQAAILALHQKEIGPHILAVSEAPPDELSANSSGGGRSPRRAYSCLY